MTEEERRKDEQLTKDFEEYHLKRMEAELTERASMKISSFLEDCNHQKQRILKEAIEEEKKLQKGEILRNFQSFLNLYKN